MFGDEVDGSQVQVYREKTVAAVAVAGGRVGAGGVRWVGCAPLFGFLSTGGAACAIEGEHARSVKRDGNEGMGRARVRVAALERGRDGPPPPKISVVVRPSAPSESLSVGGLLLARPSKLMAKGGSARVDGKTSKNGMRSTSRSGSRARRPRKATLARCSRRPGRFVVHYRRRSRLLLELWKSTSAVDPVGNGLAVTGTIVAEPWGFVEGVCTPTERPRSGAF